MHQEELLDSPSLGLRDSSYVATSDRQSLAFSSDEVDADWDAFLQASSAGHHAQTSIWGRVKAQQGYQTRRAIVRKGGQIVGGVQLLVTRKSIGKVAYAPKGPVVAQEDRSVCTMLLDAVKQWTRREGIRLVLVQPPDCSGWITEEMQRLNFGRSPVTVCPSFTTKVDLHQSEEDLLAGLKQKTRYNLRVARRKGVTIREGNSGDIAVFQKMMEATGQRQQFAVFDANYYGTMWRLFNEQNAVRLSIAEYDGTPLAAQILIAFGDTAIYKMGVWSGNEGRRHPNELLHWSAMMWARDRGLRWYDLDGISERAGEVTGRGERVTRENCKGLDVFKLSLGGSVFQVPPAFDYLPNPALRFGFRRALPFVSNMQAFRRVIHWMRTRGGQA